MRAPDGRTWKVRRLWMTRKVWLWPRNANDAAAIWPDLSTLVAGEEVILIGLLVAPLVVLVIALPAIFVAVELAVVVLVFVAGLVARLLLRRPWRVQAITEGPPRERLAWDVVGLRESGEVVVEVKAALRLGREPRPGHGAVPVRIQP